MKKKQIAAIALIFLLSFSLLLTSCGNNGETPMDDETTPVSGEDIQDSDNETEEEEPPVDEPSVEEPNVEEPKVDEPKVDEPNVEKPDTKAPNTNTSSQDTPKKKHVRVLKEDDGDIMVLVNKDYAVSKYYEPKNMVKVDGSLSTNKGISVKKVAYDAYLDMLKDAKAEGLNFCICSTYRSYDLQKSLFNNSLAANGREYTEKKFAKPGESEHHTGLAIDITSASMNWGLSQNFTDYADGAWITENCADYGFIIRYPKGKEDITGYMYEPWHIRYVGVEVAQEITEKGITLEEYLGVA